MNFMIRWALSTWFGLLYQQKFNQSWDDALNRLIEKHWADSECCNYRIVLGEVEVWISNAFYSYGHVFMMHGKISPRDEQFRPSLKTMARLDSLVRHKRNLKRQAFENIMDGLSQ